LKKKKKKKGGERLLQCYWVREARKRDNQEGSWKRGGRGDRVFVV